MSAPKYESPPGFARCPRCRGDGLVIVFRGPNRRHFERVCATCGGAGHVPLVLRFRRLENGAKA